MIPHQLQQVAQYLQKNPVNLVAGGAGGRYDSAASEEKVVIALHNANLPNITLQGANVGGGNNNTAWYDLDVAGHYVNIKITNMKGTADNTSSKKAIFYYMTGLTKFPNRDNIYWDEMCQNESPDEDRDFYFLVLSKSIPTDVFVASLKGLETLRTNGSESNHPFQCVWNKNRVPIQRTWAEGKEFLLRNYAESIKKTKTKFNKGMINKYPQFF